MSTDKAFDETGIVFPLGVDITGLKFRVRGEHLNVRSGPGITFPEVEQLKEGDIIEAKYLHAAQAWVEFAPGRFCALTYADVRYLERVLEEDE